MRACAIAEYHELLAADESLTPEFFARLKDLMSARRMLYGDRHIGVALRPYLLTREQYDRLTFAAQTIAGAFEKVGRRSCQTRPSLIESGSPRWSAGSRSSTPVSPAPP